MTLGGNWDGPVDWAEAEAEEDDGAFDGFPTQCPSFEEHPPFEWPGHGNGTPESRREDFAASITHISLTRSRDPNRPKGKDIDPAVYARIQDMENRRTCGNGFL